MKLLWGVLAAICVGNGSYGWATLWLVIFVLSLMNEVNNDEYR